MYVKDVHPSHPETPMPIFSEIFTEGTFFDIIGEENLFLLICLKLQVDASQEG